MSDLVKRLQRMTNGLVVDRPIATLKEAADRLEKLERVALAASTLLLVQASPAGRLAAALIALDSDDGGET